MRLMVPSPALYLLGWKPQLQRHAGFKKLKRAERSHTFTILYIVFLGRRPLIFCRRVQLCLGSWGQETEIHGHGSGGDSYLDEQEKTFEKRVGSDLSPTIETSTPGSAFYAFLESNRPLVASNR